MFDSKSLDQLKPVADEMLGGLQADERMRLAIKHAAEAGVQPRKAPVRRYVPAVCCAALALACVGIAAPRLNTNENVVTPADVPVTVSIDSIAAGEGAAFAGGELVADLGDNARVRMAAPAGDSLFVHAGGDIALVSVDGAVYQMLETPRDVGNSLLGESLGDVALFDEQPSLASPKEMAAGLSNVAEQGAVIYGIKGMPETTVVAAEVDGYMRLFQRVSYAGKGPAGASLEDTFGVRGKVKSAELSGVGELTGEKANEVIAVLLDNASLKSTDATARRQTLTVTLENGLKLQLGVSGDTVCGCGGWSCPEFFEAFEAAL
ncbi:MAG: hypothetical protein IJO02_07950 [Clostridia bacterium]|nr:hypothetical protein [Clostridia bacterium]